MTITDYQNNFNNFSKLVKVLIFCALLFAITLIIDIIVFNDVPKLNNWLSLPQDFNKFIYQPWSLITFPFVHTGLFQLIFGGIFLYFTHIFFTSYFNEKDFWKFFIFGNIVGAIFLMGTSLFIHSNFYVNGLMIGAYTVFFATISYNPYFQTQFFFIPKSFPIYYLGIFFGVILVFSLLISILRSSDFSEPLICVISSAFGFLYMKQYQKGNDFLDIFFKKNQINKKHKFKVHPRQQSDEEFNYNKRKNQEIVDMILDKISKKGYDSLSDEEKKILFNQK